MKILRSIHTLNPVSGGPIESVKQSSAVLASRGHDVEIVCLDAPNDPWVRESPVPIHALGPGWGSYAYRPRFSRWIKNRHRDFDAVIVHGLWQYSSFGVWRALHKTPTPYFVFPHGMLDPWFKKTYPWKHLKKRLYWPWADYRVLRDAAAVLFTSAEERRLARESFSPYHCNKAVVNYGTAAPDVDLKTARQDFLNRFPQLRPKRLFLFLGRLHEKKGCESLIESFAAVCKRAPVHLIMAGPCADDAYLLHLKNIAAGLPVTFTGMLSGNFKWGAFSAAEVFVLPSHQENFGIAVVEALASSIPVLISNKVNIWREIVEDGAGFADEDDRAGTTRLLARWIETPEQDRQLMRTNARRSFDRHFEINRATDSLLSILHEHVRAK